MRAAVRNEGLHFITAASASEPSVFARHALKQTQGTGQMAFGRAIMMVDLILISSANSCRSSARPLIRLRSAFRCARTCVLRWPRPHTDAHKARASSRLRPPNPWQTRARVAPVASDPDANELWSTTCRATNARMKQHHVRQAEDAHSVCMHGASRRATADGTSLAT